MGKITVRDMDAADALWILMRQQKREVREILAARLEESLKNEDALEADESLKADEPQKEEPPKPEGSPKSRLQPSKEAMEFLERIPMNKRGGGMEVPAGEKGVFDFWVRNFGQRRFLLQFTEYRA